MKTRKLLSVSMIALAIAISIPAAAQTKQQRNQLSWLDREMSQLKVERAKLESKIKPDYAVQITTLQAQIDSLESTNDITQANNLEKRIDQKKALLEIYQKKAAKAGNNDLLNWQIGQIDVKLDQLQADYDKIFTSVTTDENPPKEIGQRTLNRRQRGFVGRRGELVLSKIENNLGAVDPALGVSDAGYLILLQNDNQNVVTFDFCPLDGGDKTSVTMSGESTDTTYLLPGRYAVTTLLNGKKLWPADCLIVDGTVKELFEKKCFGYAFMPANRKN